jgi:hypothetical protein
MRKEAIKRKKGERSDGKASSGGGGRVGVLTD